MKAVKQLPFFIAKLYFFIYIIAMKIVVMSDSHGRSANLEKVLMMEKGADMFLHCGDLCTDSRMYPDVFFVKGNCDWDPDLPMYRVIDCGKIRILMIHGDKVWDVKRDLAELAREKNCKICVFGHIHRYYDNEYRGVRLLNPGSLAYNRDENDLGYIVIEIDKEGLYSVKRKVL